MYRILSTIHLYLTSFGQLCRGVLFHFSAEFWFSFDFVLAQNVVQIQGTHLALHRSSMCNTSRIRDKVSNAVVEQQARQNLAYAGSDSIRQCHILFGIDFRNIHIPVPAERRRCLQPELLPCLRQSRMSKLVRRPLGDKVWFFNPFFFCLVLNSLIRCLNSVCYCLAITLGLVSFTRLT